MTCDAPGSLNPAPLLDSWGLSHVGSVRSNNEDAFDAVPELGFFVVADGMGGALGGERASAVTVRTLVEEAREAAASLTVETLVQAVELANRRVRREAENNPALRGMGTTVTAAVVRSGRVHVASVGDSRAYKLARGSLECLTEDDTWVRQVARATGVSDEKFASHPYRHLLTKAVGADSEVRAATVVADFSPGDILLLCSDGLHGVMPAGLIAESLRAGATTKEKAEALIGAVLERGAPDNVTAVVVRHSAAGGKG